eukprot:Cvel_11347.t1-p1 / transcript=Cvel_11347.t1 / gene=Cvel_11347 / organism=Chromera_velia_CCMP2878 / gene_product=hypothetical protein / transcript_product=hypothetical protein / location=Cvel_scaffold711:763-5287(-) / protein_length=588 / sequence_SO=supercontig / SO=protein_coding / is_pseudo=false
MRRSGAERKRRWKANKRKQGWAWSKIQQDRRGGTSVIDPEESESESVGFSSSAESVQSEPYPSVSGSSFDPLSSAVQRASEIDTLVSSFTAEAAKRPHLFLLSKFCSNVYKKPLGVLPPDQPRICRLAEYSNARRDFEVRQCDFLCLNPFVFDPKGDRKFPSTNQKTMRGGEPYFVPSGWTRLGLQVRNMAELNELAVAFSGWEFRDPHSLLKTGFLLPAQVMTNGRVIIRRFSSPPPASVQSVPGEQTKPPTEGGTHHEKSPPSEPSSASMSTAVDGHQPLSSDHPPATEHDNMHLLNGTVPRTSEAASSSSSSSAQARGSGEGGGQNGPIESAPSMSAKGQRTTGSTSHAAASSGLEPDRPDDSACVLSPSHLCAATHSHIHSLGDGSFVQFLFQVLVDSRFVEKGPPDSEKLKAFWPDGTPLDPNFSQDRLEWRVPEADQVVVTGLLFRQSAQHPFQEAQERLQTVQRLIRLRQVSPSHLWLFDEKPTRIDKTTDRMTDWRPFPQDIQAMLNLEWQAGRAVSSTFECLSIPLPPGLMESLSSSSAGEGLGLGGAVRRKSGILREGDQESESSLRGVQQSLSTVVQ